MFVLAMSVDAQHLDLVLRDSMLPAPIRNGQQVSHRLVVFAKLFLLLSVDSMGATVAQSNTPVFIRSLVEQLHQVTLQRAM